MGIDQLGIRLDRAKEAIDIPDFHSDELLKIALAAPFTLQLPLITQHESEQIKHQHKRLAFLGDRLLDAILADYLFETYLKLTNEDLDNWRKKITARESLTSFAIKMGVPDFCSACNRPDRKSPEKEPGVYGEIFEALVAVIYLDSDRNFDVIYDWMCGRFIQEAVEADDETTITTRDFLDDLGLENFSDVWAPGDDD